MNEIEKLQQDTSNDKNNSTICVLTHLMGIFTGFLGSLIILFTTQDENVKKHAKNALNWQISLLIYLILLIIFIIFSVIFLNLEINWALVLGILFFILGFILILILFVLDFIFCIIAAIKAGEGEIWKYPLSISFFK